MNKNIASVELERNDTGWLARITYKQRHQKIEDAKNESVILLTKPGVSNFPLSLSDAQYEVCLILDIEGGKKTATFELQSNGNWLWSGKHH